MAKTGQLTDEDEDLEVLGNSGLMDMLGEKLRPCPCCVKVPKPHYKAGTARARRAAYKMESFMLETEDHGLLFIDRVGIAYRLEVDGTARERVGRVSQFIEVPVKIRKTKSKKAKKS